MDSSLKQQESILSPSISEYKVGNGKANGTFGELLQGILPNQKNFMVTFPINLFSYATFVPDVSTSHISVFPQEKKKSEILTKIILSHFQIYVGGNLIINSDIPEGKGLASSSADLVATAYALRESLNLPLGSELIGDFIAKIEPTDGVMYEGSTSFYYKEVKIKDYIADLPEIFIIALDEGHKIDTLEYNKIPKVYTPFCPSKYEHMLSAITKAIKTRDLEMIGQISTESALMNQKFNHKSFLPLMIDLCETIKGLGVAIAHSGSFVGILLDPNSKDFIFQKNQCYSAIRQHGKEPRIFNTLASTKSHPI